MVLQPFVDILAPRWRRARADHLIYQDLALQLDALQQAGVDRVYQDVGPGSLRSRPQLDECLDRLRAGVPDQRASFQP